MSSNLIYVCLLIVLLVVVFIVRLYSAKVKGWMGEKAVAAILSSLDDLQYKVINNLVLDVHGKTVQIDHLIISDFSIFVIETKNYQYRGVTNSHTFRGKINGFHLKVRS